MSFKKWLNELVYPGEPDKERPELFATALHGIINKNDDPPKPPKTPTEKYVLPKYRRKMRK